MSAEPIMSERTGRRFPVWQFTLRTLLFVMLCVGGMLTGFQCGYQSGAESRRQKLFTARVYPVADLTIDPESNQPDLDSLVDLIEQAIDPASWDTVGGPGSVSGFGLSQPSLVITQSGKNHDAIAQLLAELWKAQLSEPAKRSKPAE
jgi:hypothetical protein